MREAAGNLTRRRLVEGYDEAEHALPPQDRVRGPQTAAASDFMNLITVSLQAIGFSQWAQ